MPRLSSTIFIFLQLNRDSLENTGHNIQQPNLSLHRLCTLARKQGASFVSIESALSRPDVKEEIDALDAHYGSRGEAGAIAIGYFAGGQSPAEIEKVSPDNALGLAVIINYKKPGQADWTCSYVYEARACPASTRPSRK
jgi:hypothetical protein